MYWIDESYLTDDWRRYRVSLYDTEPEPYEGHSWIRDDDYRYSLENRYYEVDDNGDYIENNKRPYSLAGVENSKLYWLKTYLGGIPAIKEGDYYINLVSMERFHKDEYKGQDYYEKNNGEHGKNIAHLYISFFKTETL